MKEKIQKNIMILRDHKYDDLQVRQIRIGLEAGIDVNIYANHCLDWGQMQEIRIGLETGLDVSIYATAKNPEYPNIYYHAEQMKQIRLGLAAKLDVNSYLDMSSKKMVEIRTYLNYLSANDEI